MKKTLFTILVVLAGFMAYAQNIPPVDGVRMETPQDYRNADSLVVQVSRYFLSIPVDQDTNTRLSAGVFLTRWMAGSPEFYGDFNDKVFKYIKKDVDLLTVYYSCLCMFSVHYQSVKDANTVTLNAAKQFVSYIKKPGNHAVLTRQLKNMIDADDKGELKSFLKL